MSSKSLKSDSGMHSMERSSTATSDSGFWITIDLLMEREWKNNKYDVPEENQSIANNKNKKVLLKGLVNDKIRPENKFADISMKLIGDNTDQKSLWIIPRNAMALQKNKEEKYVDKDMLKRLQQTGRQEKLEAQQRRMQTREMDEKDRLKKLIINSRSNLEHYPPDMRNNPTYIFWRLINKEMEKLNRAKADAYYRKYRKSRRGTRRSSHREVEELEEESILKKSPEEPKMYLNVERVESKRVPNNISFSIPNNVLIKYEDDEIKELRKLLTVEELYQMADKIIGTPAPPHIEDDESPNR